MKVTFYIKYHTIWGQRLLISGSCTQLGSEIANAAKEMHYIGNEEWQLEITLPDTTKEIRYKYFIEDKNGIKTPEYDKTTHQAVFDKNRTSYCLYDYWQVNPDDRTFYTSAFTKNLFARKEGRKTGRNNSDTEKNRQDNKHNITMRLSAPQITPGQIVAITGNQQCFGNWNTAKALCLSTEHFPDWKIRLNSDELSSPIEYKFIVLDSKTKNICYWEEGENRIINRTPEKNSFNVIDNYPMRTPAINWKTCGTVIPVFSLRSEEGSGIGDIGDIKKLVDWAKKTGQHIIQVLPMNDTTRTHTWKDSYPYSAISIYALHPLYINIPMLGSLNDKKKAAYYNRLRKKLNAKDTVDYQPVEGYKTAYYRDYFQQEKENILKNDDYKEFIAANKEWLIPYAAFSYLRDKHNTPEFSKWGEYAHYELKKIEKFCRPGNEAYEEFSYIFFIQYTLHKQFEEIAVYARQNNVVLKGDIPIGINRESVEAWTEPDYFNMKAQTGAPPDDFSETGQNWSFPTYNWDAMEKDGFEWWKKRFLKMNNYFDSFRIDHILGFFRIWEIPLEYTEGLCGHFRPALPLSKEEIESYGLAFDKQWTKPRIHIRYITELLGENAGEHIKKYLNHYNTEHLTLNELCSTQNKIEKLFKGCEDKELLNIKNGLLSIVNEVLFIEDPYEPNHYHPRISAYKSYVYCELSDENKNAFDKLYYDFYFLRHNDFWKEIALKRLTPLIESTSMLVCGEDLGMIPASVHEVMNKLQIFSLELEHMPKIYGCEFADLTKLPYHSVCTTSTHDMNPVRAWWKENREKTQRYYNNILRREGAAPEECDSDIAEQIIRNNLQASSIMTIIPLQDWFAVDNKIKHPDANSERINIPANPDNYWCYRMHITIEELLCADKFNKKIRNMIAESQR